TPITPKLPSRTKEGSLTHSVRGGALLDAKTAPQGVTIAREFTVMKEALELGAAPGAVSDGIGQFGFARDVLEALRRFKWI
ncbi:MAG: hypothetical protein ACRD1C_14650, partial [Terriglobales bacterium]